MKHLGIAGAWLTAVALGVLLSCSSDEDDDGDGSSGAAAAGPGSGGAMATTSGGAYNTTPMGSGGMLTPPTYSGGTPGAVVSGTGGASSVSPPLATGGASIVSTTGGSTGSSGTPTGTSGLECRGTFAGLDDDCGSQATTSQGVTVNLLLVVDKSGSMDAAPEGYNQSKWDALNVALRDSLGSVRSILSLGIELFPAADVPMNCGDFGNCCHMLTSAEMDVPIGRGSATVGHIYNVLGTAEPGGGTPTAEALRRAHAYFSSGAGSTLAGERYVVLATDGGPNCNASIGCDITNCTINIDEVTGCPSDSIREEDNCCQLDSAGCLDSDATLQAIQDLRSIGVDTFVVGIPGSEQYADNLTAFAQAGGQATTGPNGEDTYYAVSASGGVEEMTQVFRDITIALVDVCELQLETAPQAVDMINVAVDCVIVNRVLDPADSGWWLDLSTDPPTVVLTGTYCEQIAGEGVERIDIIQGCASLF
jgi:hypothetical protein